MLVEHTSLAIHHPVHGFNGLLQIINQVMCVCVHMHVMYIPIMALTAKHSNTHVRALYAKLPGSHGCLERIPTQSLAHYGTKLVNSPLHNLFVTKHATCSLHENRISDFMHTVLRSRDCTAGTADNVEIECASDPANSQLIHDFLQVNLRDLSHYDLHHPLPNRPTL